MNYGFLANTGDDNRDTGIDHFRKGKQRGEGDEQMNGYRKLVTLALAVLILAAVFITAYAVEPPNIERNRLVTSVGYMYKLIIGNGDATTVSGWTLDTAQVDTSASYQIVPGVNLAVYAWLNASGDSLDNFFVDASTDGTNWAVLDTVGALAGTAVSQVTLADGAITDIMARYIRFRVDNDGADATSGTIVTAHLISSPATP